MDTITLSTGHVVHELGTTMAERIEQYDHLLRAIVIGHFPAMKDAGASEEGFTRLFAEVRKEIDHVLENEIEDHTEFLREVLLIDCGKTLQVIDDLARKEIKKKSRKR